MNLSGEILIFGVRLAGQIVRGAGFGLIGDLVVGVIGAFWLVCCSPAWDFILAQASSRKSSMQPLVRLCFC
jgi:uncharacterized membrane protein YeaQ/YmgE (transglycosylase-associated protein family)